MLLLCMSFVQAHYTTFATDDLPALGTDKLNYPVRSAWEVYFDDLVAPDLT